MIDRGEGKTAAAIILEKRAAERAEREAQARHHAGNKPPTDHAPGVQTRHVVYIAVLRPDDEMYFCQRTEVPSRSQEFGSYDEAATAEPPKGWHLGQVLREVREILWQAP